MAFYSRRTDNLPYLMRPRPPDDWDIAPYRQVGYRRPLSTPGRRDPPLLDRDYSDYRGCRRLDAGPLLYPRPPSPGASRKQMQDLESQLNSYKDELVRREKLITELKSIGSPNVPSTVNPTEKCSVCNHGNVSNTSRSDLEALQVKVEGLQSQIREMEVQLKSRDKKIHALTISCQRTKGKESRELEGSGDGSSSSDSSSSRSDDTTSILPQEVEKHTLELEAQLRELRDELARVKHEKTDATKKVEDLVGENSELKRELTLAKSKSEKMEAEKNSHCNKIIQMTSEMERMRQHNNNGKMDLVKERDELFEKQKHLEDELGLLRGRLETSHRDLTMARSELEQHMTHCGGLDRQRQHQESLARSAEAQLGSFRDSLARILSNDSVRVEPSEERIRERVEALVFAMQEKSLLIERLERRTEELARKLETEFPIANGVGRRHIKPDIAELEARLNRAENELMARDEVREGIQSDQERFWQYLRRLCVALEMEPVTTNLGLDEALLTIVARVEDIMTKDVHTLSKLKAQNHHLQQKLTRMTDQIQSKESHIELQRRKIASLEQQFGARSCLEGEKDDEFSKNRKLQKLVEKYRHELNECRAELRELKTRLLYSSDIQSRSYGNDREIVELENEVDHLEHERLRQTNKIMGLERVVHSASEEIMEKKEIANNTIHALSLELRTTKTMLEEVTSRECKLLELRLVIARMLGLDVTRFTVPDYEIISRLEKLILANQANSTAAVALDDAMSGLHDGFQAGYHQAGHALCTPRRRARSRSLSPLRKIDNKVY